VCSKMRHGRRQATGTAQHLQFVNFHAGMLEAATARAAVQWNMSQRCWHVQLPMKVRCARPEHVPYAVVLVSVCCVCDTLRSTPEQLHTVYEQNE
jgi:hypothetical protein